jgi:hypothetical protein
LVEDDHEPFCGFLVTGRVPCSMLNPKQVAVQQFVAGLRFAALIGKDRKTVTQHRQRPGFPDPGPDGKYDPDDLLEYWNTRPGRRI